jgi:small subunit ribosomal protein S1
MNFGSFVQLAEGVEGLVHVSEITAERRINHPQDLLRVGQIVKAQVLAVDLEKRQIKLSMKQLVPTSIGEYLEEHKVNDVVSGRVVELSTEGAIVELGEGIRAICRMAASAPVVAKKKSDDALDLSSLTSMLNARWKGGATPVGSQPEPLGVGQIRSFRIVKLDRVTEKIELELA